MAATSHVNLGFLNLKVIFAGFGHCHEENISAVFSLF